MGKTTILSRRKSLTILIMMGLIFSELLSAKPILNVFASTFCGLAIGLSPFFQSPVQSQSDNLNQLSEIQLILDEVKLGEPNPIDQTKMKLKFRMNETLSKRKLIFRENDPRRAALSFPSRSDKKRIGGYVTTVNSCILKDIVCTDKFIEYVKKNGLTTIIIAVNNKSQFYVPSQSLTNGLGVSAKFFDPYKGEINLVHYLARELQALGVEVVYWPEWGPRLAFAVGRKEDGSWYRDIEAFPGFVRSDFLFKRNSVLANANFVHEGLIKKLREDPSFLEKFFIKKDGKYLTDDRYGLIFGYLNLLKKEVQDLYVDHIKDLVSGEVVPYAISLDDHFFAIVRLWRAGKLEPFPILQEFYGITPEEFVLLSENEVYNYGSSAIDIVLKETINRIADVLVDAGVKLTISPSSSADSAGLIVDWIGGTTIPQDYGPRTYIDYKQLIEKRYSNSPESVCSKDSFNLYYHEVGPVNLIADRVFKDLCHSGDDPAKHLDIGLMIFFFTDKIFEEHKLTERELLYPPPQRNQKLELQPAIE